MADFPPPPSSYPSVRLRVGRPSVITHLNDWLSILCHHNGGGAIGNVRTKFISEMILLSHKTHSRACDPSLFRMKLRSCVTQAARSPLWQGNSLTFCPSAAVTSK